MYDFDSILKCLFRSNTASVSEHTKESQTYFISYSIEVAIVLSVRDLGTIPLIQQTREASHEALHQVRQYDLPLSSSIFYLP